jgi:uncharacterized membrane protein
MDAMSSPANDRCQAIDIARLYAMLAMLLSHAAGKLNHSLRLAGGWDTNQLPTVSGLSAVVGAILHLASPLFALLTGFSLAFFVVSRQRKQRPAAEIDGYLLRRGALLLVLGVLVDSFHLDPPHWTFDPGILGMFGLALWVLIPLRRLSPAALFAIAGLLAALVQGHLLMRGSATTSTWIEGLLLTTGGPARGLLFPLLPWLPVILLGFASGRLVAEGKVTLETLAGRVAMGLLVLWCLLLTCGHPLLFRKHPPSLDFLLPYTAAGFGLLALHARFRQPERWWFYRHMVVLGRCALFFYLIHSKVVLNALAYLVMPLALPMPWSAALLALLALVVLVPLCRAVQGPEVRDQKSEVRGQNQSPRVAPRGVSSKSRTQGAQPLGLVPLTSDL